MELFYSTKIHLSRCILEGEEAIHCVQSLRKNTGDIVHVTDGKGKGYQGVITEIEYKKNIVTVEVQKQETKTRTHHIGLCISPTKHADRMEWLVEKAVELGVCEIQWIITQHSQRKSIAIPRMQRIAIAAMKQSLQYFIPDISQIQLFSEWIQQNEKRQGIIGYCGDIPKKPLHTLNKPMSEDLYWVCIGPEGDFTSEEIACAIDKGLLPVSIGKHRLRTETAALTAISYFYSLYDD